MTDEGMFGGTKPSAGVRGMRGGCGRKGHPAPNSQQSALLSTGNLNNTEGKLYRAVKNDLVTTREKSRLCHLFNIFQENSLMLLLAADGKYDFLQQHQEAN